MKPLLMDRLDFDIKVVELPRLGEREVAGFLKYRIAGLYPGQPGETAFDFRIWQRGKTRYAFLFITRRSVLESYRQKAAGGPLLLPCLLILPFVKEYAGEQAAFLYLSPTCLETLVFRAGEPPAAFVARRSRRLAADLDAARRLAAGAPSRWVILSGPEEAEGLAAQAGSLAAGGSAPRLIPVTEALDRLGPRDRGLFAPPGRAPLLSAGLRRQLLAAALLFLAFLTLKKLTDREEAYHRSLMREAGLLQSRSAVTVALQAEVELLLKQKAALLQRRPEDPYRLLSELQAVLSPAARIQAFVLERRFFQLEAVGANPLALMDSFRERSYFGEARLLQTMPLPGSDQEQFKITGRVRGE
jgi:hypothetical protein